MAWRAWAYFIRGCVGDQDRRQYCGRARPMARLLAFQETVDFCALAHRWWAPPDPQAGEGYDRYPAPGICGNLYAVSPSLGGNTGAANARVLFNFRHALSRVTVKMKPQPTATSK